MIYTNKEFTFNDGGAGTTFSDIEFCDCYFEGCAISATIDPQSRTTVRNVRIKNCSQRGCLIGCAIIEDCVVDGFKTNGQHLQSWAAVFNRVTLIGSIDKIMISSVVGSLRADKSIQSAFERDNAEYYRGVSWAIDISKALFLEADLRGVPGHLVRRDPDTQVLVTREKALSLAWQDLPFKERLWPVSLSLFLDTGSESIVLVAPKRHRRFRVFNEDLNLLRREMIAEPD
jgi:hypothetical protein